MIQPTVFVLVALFAVVATDFNDYGNGRPFGNRRGTGSNRKGGSGIGIGGGSGQVGDLTFLANVTDPAVRMKFQAIYFNHTLDETARATAVDALVSTLDPSVQTAYAQWKADQAQKKAERETLLVAQLANLTVLADQMRDGVYAIRNNASLPNEEKILLLPSEFDKFFKSLQQIMNGLYYVGGAPRPEDVDDGEEYPSYPDYSGNYPDYGGQGGLPGRPGSVWPPRGGPGSSGPGNGGPGNGGPGNGGPNPAWPPRGGPSGGPFGIVGGPVNRPNSGGFPGGNGGGINGGNRPNPFGPF
uniref:SXP/RAL-2 family protein Ani s 5-like cation-binding domain-containing protein n=1 Tax=Plectus sambesii TaxID=2011161 RepID=A0A914V4N8_9BILA